MTKLAARSQLKSLIQWWVKTKEWPWDHFINIKSGLKLHMYTARTHQILMALTLILKLYYARR